MFLSLNQRPVSRQDRLVVILALAALVVKVFIAWNTLGTNDTVTFFQFARFLNENSLAELYQSTKLFNHPPLTAYYLEAIGWLHALPAAPKKTFPFLLRLPGIMADLGTVFVLLAIVKREARLRPPPWAMLLFAASPVSIMVSGFHGNTDSVLVLLLAIALLMVLADHAVLCGLFLALSCQVKIIPLLILPIFFFYWLRRAKAASFAIPFAVTWLLFSLQPLIQTPVLFVKDVLSYGSYSGLWGVTYLLRLTGAPQFHRIGFYDLTPAQTTVATVLKLVIIAGVLLIAWRRRVLPAGMVPESLAFAWTIFFVFSPGVGPQYMVWLAPFVLLSSAKCYAALVGASTIFLFSFYDAIAGGLPWYYARSVDELVWMWERWTLLPWLTLIGMLIYFLRRTGSEVAGLREVDRHHTRPDPLA